MQGQSFAAMKQALRDAGLNTHRQISDWIKEPTVPPPVAARGTQRASAGTAPARAISPGTADRQSGKRPGPGIGPDPEKTGALGLRDFFSGLVTRDEGYRTLSPEGTALIPFTGPMADAVAAYDVVRAARRVRDGTDTAADLRILEAFQEQDAEAQQRGTTLLYDVASIVAHLPAFAVEFAATGGAFTGVKTLVEQSLLKVAPKIAAKRATQIAARGAGYTAGAAAQEALMPQRVVAEAVRRQTPTPKELQDGLKDWDDDFVPALVRAVPDQFVEVFSERTGAALAGPLAKLAKLPIAQRVAALKAVVLKDWLKLHPGGSVTDFLAKVKSETGWHGILGEMFEERVAEGMRAAQPYLSEPGQPDAAMIRMVTGGQTDPARPDASPRVEALKDFGYQMATEALAFAVPGVTGKVLERLANGKPDEFQATLDEIDAFIKQAPDRPLPRTMSPLCRTRRHRRQPQARRRRRVSSASRPTAPPSLRRQFRHQPRRARTRLRHSRLTRRWACASSRTATARTSGARSAASRHFRTARPPSTARTARGVLSN